MKINFVFIFCLCWVTFIHPQQHTLLLSTSNSQLVSQTFNEYSNQTTYTQEGYDYGNWRDYINNTNPVKYIYYNYKAAYQFSLTSIPANAYNISAKIDAYRTSGTGSSEIVSLPDNLFNSGNYSAYWNAVGDGTHYFYVENNPGTYNDVTQLVLSKLQQGFINVGVRQSSSELSLRGNIAMVIQIKYDLPINMTADNNFTAPDNTHGKIIVDGNQKDAPYLISVNAGTSKTFQAVSPQYDNLGHQVIWHTGSINQSEWKRNGVKISDGQTYAFTVSTGDDNSTYQANLRPILNVSFQNYFIGLGNGGTITVNSSSYSSPTSNFNVVESNPITASVTSQSFNNITYYFSNWSTSSTNSTETFYPTGNATITANYTGIAAQSVGLNFESSNPNLPITLHRTEYPNSYVTQYQIWRKVRYNQGTTSDPELIATVSRGTTSYVDYEYSGTSSGYTDWLLWYDVRSYYSTEGTYPPANWASVFSNGLLAKGLGELAVTENKIENYPNPFNPSTVIRYQLVNSGPVSIKVYDIVGREIMTLVNEEKQQGRYQVKFDASNLSSGIYFYRIVATGFTESKKMILTK